jgi:hypothetical protein
MNGSNACRRMGLTLSRPFLIVQTTCASPSCDLEYDPAYPDVPSPFTQIMLEYQLFESIFELLPLTNNPAAPTMAVNVKKRIDEWFSRLPAVFRECDPDTRFQSTHSYLVRHRLQILCSGYTTYISILKSTVSQIMNNPSPSPTEVHIAQQLRSATITAGLRLSEVSEALFAIFIPNSPKYFMVNSIPSETAAFFCSTLLQDKDNRVARRSEILQAIGKSLAMIGFMKSITKTGTIAWNALIALISKLSLTENERKLIDPEGNMFSKRRKPAKRVAQSNESGGSHQQVQASPLNFQPEMVDTSFSTASALDVDWQFGSVQALSSVSPTLGADFGLLDPIWSWDDVNFPPDDLSTTQNTHGSIP